MKDKNITYEESIVKVFTLLVDIFGVDKAIILLYMLNKNRGLKI